MQKLTPTRFRFIVQALFTLFCVYIGVRFTLFLAWATGKTETFVPKPGAVEGFLPISALLALKRLIVTGQWDPIHPAGLAIFLAVLLMAFLFRKGFCGYICPVGFLSNLAERLGRKFKLGCSPHRYVDITLKGVKYLLLAGFCFAILSMSVQSLESFITGPYNMVADARMMHFFTSPSALSLLIIGLLVVLSVIFRNFWCRYLCPYGALLGILAFFGPVHVRRDKDTCIDCGKCNHRCPVGIDVQHKGTVRTPECMGCGECVGTCPVDGCLGFSVTQKKRLPWLVVGIGSILTLLLVWAWAKSTGHWDMDMPQDMVRRMYSMLLGKG